MSIVFEIDDIRNYIFSYLRKKANRQCIQCNRICIWDKKLIKGYMMKQNNCICLLCLKNINYELFK
jgi:hypothetical protein